MNHDLDHSYQRNNDSKSNKYSDTSSKNVSNESRESKNDNENKTRNKNDDSNDEIEEKIRDLILMTGGKGPKRWKQRKKEYLKKLENDNAQLKNVIVDLQQKINAYQSQKSIVLDQLRYFQGCLDQAAPFILQQSNEKNENEKS